MSTDNRKGATFERASLRLPATLLLAGQLLYIVITLFHADGKANNHPAVFAEYASSSSWKAIHVGQFGAAVLLLAGLFALYFALDVQAGAGRWASRFAAASTVAAIALYGVLQAVDGIGNKQVDAAWVNAPNADKAARFASAEAMRWLEWGVRSYLDYAIGLALVLFAATIVLTAVVPRAIGYIMALSGLTYWAQGWVVGAHGFSGTHDSLIIVTELLSVVWMIWLVVVTWRATQLKESRTAPEPLRSS